MLGVELSVEWGMSELELSMCCLLVAPTHDPRDPFRHILAIGGRFDLAPWKKPE